MQTEALVDSGAAMSFIDAAFVKQHNLVTSRLNVPIDVYNVDGTANSDGQMKDISQTDLLTYAEP